MASSSSTPSKGGGNPSSPKAEGTEHPGPNTLPNVLKGIDGLRVLCDFDFPKDALVVIPGVTERATTPLEDTITVYEHHLQFGLRFPSPPLFQKVLVAADLCLGQVIPIYATLLLAFEGLTASLGFSDLSPAVFFHFFSLMRSHEAGVPCFLFRGKPSLKIFTSLPSKVWGWRERFLFLAPPAGSGIRYTWNWKATPQVSLPELTETEHQAIAHVTSVVESGPLDLFSFIRPILPAR